MIQVFPDYEALSQAAAELFVQQAHLALQKGKFSVALSGGETPWRAYELLSRSPLMDQVPWKIVHFFWGDERWVPVSNPRSNAGMARKALLDHIPVPEDQILQMYHPDKTIEEAADDYEDKLRKFFAGEPHLFDLVFLGLGENGHTASLFPDAPALRETGRWVQTVDAPARQDVPRLTLTAEAINRSAQVAFIVSGANKSGIVHEVLEGPRQETVWPAQLIHPLESEASWLLDQAAARRLSQPVQMQASSVRR